MLGPQGVIFFRILKPFLVSTNEEDFFKIRMSEKFELFSEIC